MKPDTFTVAEAAKLVGIEPGRIRGWQQHRYIEFGVRGRTGRYRFNARDVRVIALMVKLIDHGLEPGIAARQATTIVDRARDWPLVAVFSRDPGVSPCLIPEDVVPQTEAMIMVSLAPLWRRLEGAA